MFEDLYLVGGAVRDHLLGQPIKDYDYVLFNKEPSYLTDRGFYQVGSKHPVYIHKNYPNVQISLTTGTVFEDAIKRDFTINALYIKVDDINTDSILNFSGNIIDPIGTGVKNIRDKQLVIVPDAICNDPTRFFRLARLASTYNFTVVNDSEVKHLDFTKVHDISIQNELVKIFEEPNYIEILENICSYELIEITSLGLSKASIASYVNLFTKENIGVSKQISNYLITDKRKYLRFIYEISKTSVNLKRITPLNFYKDLEVMYLLEEVIQGYKYFSSIDYKNVIQLHKLDIQLGLFDKIEDYVCISHLIDKEEHRNKLISKLKTYVEDYKNIKYNPEEDIPLNHKRRVDELIDKHFFH